MRSGRRTTTDAGFTLIEAVICISLMGLLSTVIAAAIVVTMKSSPAVADRADAAVNVQGLVTWLPQDVDSATPGTFDIADATSGCAGVDPGHNVLKMTWHEQITSLTNYSVSYRYVPLPTPADGGKIVRVYCTTGGARSELTVTGVIPAWDAADPPVRIALTDSPADADALEDSAKITVEPVVGKTIVIDATTKNLNETLSNPPPVPSPPPPPPSPSNTAPVALNSAQTAKAAIDVAMNVSASDADGGDTLTVSLLVIPAGWTVTTSGGLGIVVNAPVSAVGTTGSISFQVTDTSGATATASVNVTVELPAIPNLPPTASPSVGSTTPGVPVTVSLAASDPENAALSTSLSGVPVGWAVSTTGASVTVTPPNTSPAGSTTLNYTVADLWGVTAASTLTITVTGPPPCVVTGPTLSRSSDPVKHNNPDSLTHDITVTINIVSGYCVGLNLRYDTGAPNSQYMRIFGDAGSTRSVTLPNHPSPELWSVGTHALDVWDGTSRIIATTNLEVTPW